jgi:hypothetical protein
VTSARIRARIFRFVAASLISTPNSIFSPHQKIGHVRRIGPDGLSFAGSSNSRKIAMKGQITHAETPDSFPTRLF